jgi:hypothetical protein
MSYFLSIFVEIPKFYMKGKHVILKRSFSSFELIVTRASANILPDFLYNL